MLKQRKSNKLTLNKESLRTLQSRDLARVGGGVMKNTKSCADGGCGGGGTGGGGGGEDTFFGCWESYLACYF